MAQLFDFAPNGPTNGGIPGAVSDLADQQLKMAFLSKQIGLQAAAQSAARQQEHDLNQVPAAQASSLAKSLGFNLPTDTGDLSQQSMGSFLEAAGNTNRAQAMQNKPVHITTKPDANNQVTEGFVSPATGQWLNAPGQPGGPTVSLDPKSHEELNKIDTQVGNAKNMVNQINQLAQKVLPQLPAGVPLNRIYGAMQKGLMPTDPDLKTFIDLAGGMQAQYQKDALGQAPRSAQLMQMEGTMFPSMTDDGPTAASKATQVALIASNKGATAHTVYDPKDILHSQNHPATQGVQASQQNTDSATDNTITSLQQLAAQEIQRRKSLRNATNAPKQ